jgi:hypothetical protein
MPEDPLQREDVAAASEKVRRVLMPQVVDAHPA